MSGADPIPTVREDAATGQVAAIFEDLRATLGIPFVNLIWRHLATMPPMLNWSWAVVKQLHQSGVLPAHVRALQEAVQVPPGTRQPGFVFDAAGVTVADRAEIAALLRHYNDANGANLLSLSVVQCLLENLGSGLAEVGVPSRVTAAAPRQVRPAPRLLGLDELSPSMHALVMALDGFGRRGETSAVASLYRHLAHWPGFLAVIHAALGPAQHDGTLRAEHERTAERSRTIVLQDLLPMASAPPLPEAGDVMAAHRSIAAFTEHMIARMLTTGVVMLHVLEPE